jgi:hypothetical protein
MKPLFLPAFFFPIFHYFRLNCLQRTGILRDRRRSAIYSTKDARQFDFIRLREVIGQNYNVVFTARNYHRFGGLDHAVNDPAKAGFRIADGQDFHGPKMDWIWTEVNRLALRRPGLERVLKIGREGIASAAGRMARREPMFRTSVHPQSSIFHPRPLHPFAAPPQDNPGYF